MRGGTRANEIIFPLLDISLKLSEFYLKIKLNVGVICE